MAPSVCVLKRLYLDEGLSDADIASQFGVAAVTVSRWRQRFGIDTLANIDRRKRLESIPHLSVDEATLRRLYLDEGLGLAEIGRLFGCSRVPIRQALFRFGIRPTTKWEKHGLGDEIPEDVLPFIIGTLLGDGCIAYGDGVGNTRYSVNHSHGQYTYLKQKHARLGHWARGIRKSEKQSHDGGRFLGYGFTSVSHPAFRRLRQAWYRDDLRGQFPTSWLKSPPLKVLSTLTDESLAYWYFDDGTRGFSIATFFPLIPPEEIAACVSTATGLRWYPKGAADGQLFQLSLRASDHTEFQERILPWATPDVAVKFDRAFWSRIQGTPEMPPDAVGTERLVRYSIPAWQNLKDRPDVQEIWIQDVFSIYRSSGFPFPRLVPDGGVARAVAAIRRHHEAVDDGHVFRRLRTGINICDGLSPERFRAASVAFDRDDALLQVIREQFKSPTATSMSPASVRRVLSGGVRLNGLRPTMVKALVDNLCPENGVVLDGLKSDSHFLGTVLSDRNPSFAGAVNPILASALARVGFPVRIATNQPADIMLADTADGVPDCLRVGGVLILAGVECTVRGFRLDRRLWHHPTNGRTEPICVYVKVS